MGQGPQHYRARFGRHPLRAARCLPCTLHAQRHPRRVTVTPEGLRNTIVAEIEFTFELADGSRHELIRVDRAAVTLQEDGVVHCRATIDQVQRIDADARSRMKEVDGKSVTWRLDQFDD